MPFSRFTARLAALALSGALAGGCVSRQAGRTADVLAVSIPFVEQLDVSDCEGDATAINLRLSARAEDYARPFANASVWYGDGLSMSPLLEPGSWVVIRPWAYEELKPGMIVLYTNNSGRRIAHALVRKTPHGWLAAGVNNRSPDRELVTPLNIAGVLAAAFTPSHAAPAARPR